MKTSETYNLTNEDAIDAIEKNMILTEALEMAIKVLAKQKPNDHLDEKCCPTCLERVTFQTWKHGYQVVIKMNYCQACGQAIDWSEE